MPTLGYLSMQHRELTTTTEFDIVLIIILGILAVFLFGSIIKEVVYPAIKGRKNKK